MERRLSRKKQHMHTRLVMKRHWQMYLMMLVPMAFILVFNYMPMSGLVIAFKNYSFTKGIWGSRWVGLKHFDKLINSYMFPRLMSNTFLLSIFTIAVCFPIPIVFAVLLNECRRVRYRKFVQMVSYAPHFMTTVVIVSILNQLFNYYHGVVNVGIQAFGGTAVDFLGHAGAFRPMYVFSGLWQNMGYNSIIYIAALASVDPQLEEAATIDGANRLQKIWHIDLPTIMPTIVIMLILRMGTILDVGYEKVYLMQNDINIIYSEVISTYVYKMGLLDTQYSFAAAVGIFNSVINLVIVLLVNWICRRLGDTSLW